jgi:hypothetical protein
MKEIAWQLCYGRAPATRTRYTTITIHHQGAGPAMLLLLLLVVS